MTKQFIPPKPNEIETLLNSARPSLAPLTEPMTLMIDYAGMERDLREMARYCRRG